MPYRSNNGPIEINRNANGFTWVLLSGRTFALTPGLVNRAVAFLLPPLLVWASPMSEAHVTQFYVMARDDQSWVSLLSCRRKQADGRGQHSLCPPCPLVCVSLASCLGFARSYGLTIKNIADTSKAKAVSSSGPLLSTTFANGFHIVPLSVRPVWLQDGATPRHRATPGSLPMAQLRRSSSFTITVLPMRRTVEGLTRVHTDLIILGMITGSSFVYRR